MTLAEATQTNKKTAGEFLDALSALAYKELKKDGEFVLPGFGKLVKQQRKARAVFNPKTQQNKIPAKTVLKLRIATRIMNHSCKGTSGAGPMGLFPLRVVFYRFQSGAKARPAAF